MCGQAHIRGGPDRSQQVLDHGPVQHLLSGDAEDHPAPPPDRGKLISPQSRACGALEAERGVQVLAHQAMLELSSLGQQIGQLLTVPHHDVRLAHKRKAIPGHDGLQCLGRGRRGRREPVARPVVSPQRRPSTLGGQRRNRGRGPQDRLHNTRICVPTGLIQLDKIAAPNGGSARGYFGVGGASHQSRYGLLDGRLFCIFIHRRPWGECPHLPRRVRAAQAQGRITPAGLAS